MGMGQERQLINYVERHFTMEQHSKDMSILLCSDKQSADEEVEQSADEADTTPELAGSRMYTKTIHSYSLIHEAGSSYYTSAFKCFERSLRIYLYLLDNEGEHPPEGPRGDLEWLPDLFPHKLVIRPRLNVNPRGHPQAKFSPTVKSLTPRLHGSSHERFDDM